MYDSGTKTMAQEKSKKRKKGVQKAKKVFPCGGTIPGLERTNDWRRPIHEKLIYYRCTTEELVVELFKTSFTSQ
jgi:hypothetical protein